eukprot:SAG11_NODE_2128_length_3781_cov_1.507061_3_plen_51_part_00
MAQEYIPSLIELINDYMSKAKDPSDSAIVWYQNTCEHMKRIPAFAEIQFS